MKRYNPTLGIIDMTLQGIMLLMAVVSALSIFFDMTGGIYVMVLQFFIGLYQICSGIIGAALGRKWKVPYLIGALFYIIILGAGTAILSEIGKGHDAVFFLAIIGGIIIPWMIAIGYFVMSIKTFRDMRLEEEYSNPIKRQEYMDESILDEGIV